MVGCSPQRKASLIEGRPAGPCQVKGREEATLDHWFVGIISRLDTLPKVHIGNCKVVCGIQEHVQQFYRVTLQDVDKMTTA